MPGLVFKRAGELRGAAPALLGMARGDRLLAPNSATMAQMRPQERITPAGRFVSQLPSIRTASSCSCSTTTRRFRCTR
jgi:hypothetical protein